MQRVLQFFRSHKIKFLGFFVAFSLIVASLPIPVFAGVGVAVEEFLRNVLYYGVVAPISVLMNLALYILIQVAQYNDFADASIVNTGWTILRDVSNMFFVLILLVIAIGTIVKWQVVNYRQNLRRLVLMALLINFSKTIAIFFIDFSQVITLTFITAVRDVLQAGFLTALGLDLVVNPISQGTATSAGNSLFTYLAAAIMMLIAFFVVLAYVLIFVVRIIALWLLLVFSPLAFLASTLPQTKKYYEQWWDLFGKNLTVAPILAFMLWLVFAVVSKGNDLAAQVAGDPATTGASVEVDGFASSTLIGFAVSTGLLVYSIKLAASMGAAGGKMAQSMIGKVEGQAKKIGNRVAWGKSGEGGVLGRASTVVSAAGAGIAGGIGLTTTAQNIRIRQAERMEKREAAEGKGFKRLNDKELEDRANSMRTSAPERAVIRKEQVTRGKVGTRRMEEVPAEEMQRIRQQIEYKTGGALTSLGVRGDTAFTRDKMDLRSQHERTPDEQEDKARAIEREIRKKNPKVSAGDLRDETVQSVLMSEVRAGRKSHEDINKLLQGAEQETVDIWVDMLKNDLNAMTPDEAKSGRGGTQNRALLARLDPQNALRYSMEAIKDPENDKGSQLPVLPPSEGLNAEKLEERRQAILGKMDFKRASNVARSMRPEDVGRLSDEDLKIFALHTTGSNFNALARSNAVSPEQMDIMLQAVNEARQNEANIPDGNGRRKNIQSIHKTLSSANSQFREDYRAHGEFPDANDSGDGQAGGRQGRRGPAGFRPGGRREGGTTGGGSAGSEGGNDGNPTEPGPGPQAGNPGGGGGAGGSGSGSSSAGAAGIEIPGQEGRWRRIDADPEDSTVMPRINNGELQYYSGDVYERIPNVK